MTDIPSIHVSDVVPTYLTRGDPAGRFADYYPTWVNKMADDVTLEGSLLDGAVQGIDTVRAVIGGARELYDRQDFNFAGPSGRRWSVAWSSRPVHRRGAVGMHGWAPEAIGAAGAPGRSTDAYLDVLLTRTAATRQASVETLRLSARRADRDTQRAGRPGRINTEPCPDGRSRMGDPG